MSDKLELELEYQQFLRIKYGPFYHGRVESFWEYKRYYADDGMPLSESKRSHEKEAV